MGHKFNHNVRMIFLDMKFLLVEDDKTIASGLEYSLQQERYSTIICHDVASAKQVLAEDIDQFALCLFDLQLPDGSGYELCKMVKERRDIPVIFLTVIDDEVNVVMGLDMGADDYITKPFRVRELLSRIKSVLRRYQKPSQVNSIMDIDDIRINTLEGKVFKNGAEIALTALEYRLLLIFGNHIGQVLSRNQLLEQIWDVAGDFVNDNTLTVYIKRLREKLEDDPGHPTLIKTVRGLGYKVGD
ncbi:putative sensory transduction protein RegX3 [Paenibacillus sp. HGF5]|nr:putative sensory transduction protein RegX3 [Paenibacillus sp. HGF5]